MSKPKIKIGQRWIWNNCLIAEIISDDVSGKVPNAKCIQHLGNTFYFAELGTEFRIMYSMSVWEYLEGQDKINFNLHQA